MVLSHKAIRTGILCFCLLGGMMESALGQDLVVDGGTTNITSSTNYANTYIGFDPTASNNLLNVLGSGVVLSNSADVYVGFLGSSNSLAISNGGSVINQVGYIGFTTFTSNNSVLVTGTNSAWTNSSDLYVGLAGSSNSLVISDGGIVANSGLGTIGVDSISSNNIVTVTGSGSCLLYTSDAADE